MSKDEFKCDFCETEQDTLYEGWFRNAQAFNPFAKGTVSAGVMQKRRVCKQCANEAIDSGVSYAKGLPDERN